MKTIVLPSGLQGRLAKGHPWVYRDQVPGAREIPTGAWVRVRAGGYVAFGLWDASGSIAIRLFSRHKVPEEGWVAERVAEAWTARAQVRSGPTSAYRWVYGESDNLPGMVVDLYGHYAVIQTYSESLQCLLGPVADALHAHVELEGILWRRSGQAPASLWGRLPPEDLTIEENGLLFHVHLLAGQKTGFYFDHRENRLALSAYCGGQSVLDCFCYSGAFSLYAVRAGAVSVTACDRAAAAVAEARRNFLSNGYEPDQHTFLVGDAFELLEQFAAGGRRFGVVVLDPPSFARDKQSRHAALRAYVRLNRLALGCVETGGILASASCTSQVSPPAFTDALAEAARRAGRRLLVLHDAGQPVDHPVPAHFPEARYLKFIVSRVLPVV